MTKIFRVSVSRASRAYRCAATGKPIKAGALYVSVFGLKGGKPVRQAYAANAAPADVKRRLSSFDRAKLGD